MEKARKFILKIFDLLMRPELRILPGHLAFYLVMTLIPLAALIITLTARADASKVEFCKPYRRRALKLSSSSVSIKIPMACTGVWKAESC